MSVSFSKRALINSALFICLFSNLTLGAQTLDFRIFGHDSVEVAPVVFQAAWSDDSYWAKVKYVIDGDTVVLDDDTRVRLIGINAPEKGSDLVAAEPFSLEARLLLQSLVLGKNVRVINGIEPFDKYRRSLAYLELENGSDVHQALLEAGYATFVAISPNIRRIEKFQISEQAARVQGRGIWSLSNSFFESDLSNPTFSKGFNLMRSTVSVIRESENQFFIELNNGLAVIIANADWDKYWNKKPVDQYLDKSIEVRGWVFNRGDQYMVKITHPSMIVEIQ